MTFRIAMEAEQRRRGPEGFARGCVRLLAGADPRDDPDLVHALAGERHADRVLRRDARADMQHWARVWAARGLLWHWHPLATALCVAALEDEHWRVREMVAKVLGRHEVGDALAALARRREDPVERVRVAAARAEARIVARGG